MRLVIVTPVFVGDGTGASVYYQLLARALVAEGVGVTVVSERGATASVPGVAYRGLLPPRSSRRKILVRDAFVYAAQNLAYLRLPRILDEIDPDVLMVHSSFYNLPGIFPRVARALLRRDVRTVADVRDGLVPARNVAELARYDAVVACSRNVEAHLSRGVPRDKLIHIPVPQEPLRPDPRRRDALLREHGLAGGPYLLYAGLIKELKSVDLLLRAFREHVLPQRPDLTLVLSGLVKTSNPYILASLRANGVRHLGNLPRRDVLALMGGAALCVNLSPNESLSRSSLEALALGRRAVLPPNIPEYLEHCPQAVAEDRSPEGVARLMLGALEAPPPRYPIERHAPDALVPRYRDLLVAAGA